MKTWMLILLLALLPAASQAAEDPLTDPGERDFPADYEEVHTDPEPGEGIRKYAEDA